MTALQSRRATLRWWERILERIASTRPGGWFYVSIATWLDQGLLRISRGRISCALTWPSLLLTTTGAHTGRTRTVPLLYLADGDRLILVASNGGRPHHPAWYYNLKTYPRAQIAIRGQSQTYLAHEASAEERAQWWPRMVDLFRGYASYQQRNTGRTIPLVVLTPERPGV